MQQAARVSGRIEPGPSLRPQFRLAQRTRDENARKRGQQPARNPRWQVFARIAIGGNEQFARAQFAYRCSEDMRPRFDPVGDNG